MWVLLGLCLAAAAGLVAPGLAGQLGIFLWLGVFPGMAAARLLLPRAAPLTRWTLGLTLSPIVSAGAGWALQQAGFDMTSAARLIRKTSFSSTPSWVDASAARSATPAECPVR